MVNIIKQFKRILNSPDTDKRYENNQNFYSGGSLSKDPPNSKDEINSPGQCPLCRNHCSLQAPRCMRGKAYSKKNFN